MQWMNEENGSISKHKANKVKEKHSKVFIYVRQNEKKWIHKRSFISWTIHTSATIQFNLPMITTTNELKIVCVCEYVQKGIEKNNTKLHD